jgi:hypothetical protein
MESMNWIVYHGREKTTAKKEDCYKEQRQMRLDPILWMGDKMFVPGPSFKEQMSPAMPAFRDLFEQDTSETLGEGWRVLNGNWSAHNSQGIQENVNGISSAIIDKEVAHYRYEVNVKWEPHHLGGRYGIYACYQDAYNNVQFLFDVGKRQVVAFAIQNGVKGKETKVQLEDDFNFPFYHKLTVIKAGNLLRIFVDGIYRFHVQYSFATTCVGLVTQYTSASFAGVSLTRCFSLDQHTQEELYTCLQDANGQNKSLYSNYVEMVKGGMVCRPKMEKQNLIFNDEFRWRSYRLQFDFQLINQSVDGVVGVYPSYISEDNYIRISLDPKEKKVIIDKHSSTGVEQISLNLLYKLDINAKHTFFIRKVRERIASFNKRNGILNETISGQASTVGLFFSREAQIEALEWVQL